MKNFRSVFVLILAALVMTSCNPLKKMQKNAGMISYEVNPEVLEAHGGQVALNIKGVFPEKYFDRTLLQRQFLYLFTKAAKLHLIK